MKLYPFLPLCAAALALAGCEDVDVPSTLREGLGVSVPPHVRIFAADEKATYAAARAALGPMGYTFEHGGPAEREIDALSHISSGDEPATARQFTLKAKFEPSLDGTTTEVSVKMDEIDEEGTGHNLGRATEAPLTDTPLYEVFFNEIQKNLKHPPAAKQSS